MQITYTARELYELIRSYDVIEFWGNQNQGNISMVVAKTSCVTFSKGKKYCYITIDMQFPFESDLLCCCCNITGNVFSCEVERGGESERLIITSNYREKDESVVIVLKKL